MKAEIRYISADGTAWNTEEEALEDDFYAKLRSRLSRFFPDDCRYDNKLDVGQVARRIEAIMEALGAEFDREKFMEGE